MTITAHVNFLSTQAPTALSDAGYVPETVTFDIAEPCWLYAGRVTEWATGARLAFAYRSTALRTDGGSPRSKALLSFTEGLIPGDVARVIPDAQMMFVTGELTIWEARL